MEKSPTVFRSIAFLLLAGVWLAGCGRDDVRVYEAPKENTSTAGRGIVDGPPTLPAPLASDASSRPQWALPAGWAQVPSTEAMRYATLQVDPADPSLQVTVSSAMGDLLANVNRWEGQVGAPISTQADLANVVTHVTNNSLQIDLVDLNGTASPNGESKRMLAAILYRDDADWFVKLMGPASKVSAHKDEFQAFVKSITFANAPADASASAQMPPDSHADMNTPPPNAPAEPHGGMSVPPGMHTPMGPVVAGVSGIKSYRVPDGWSLDSTPSPMRLITFHIYVQAADQRADVIISAFGNDEFGDRVANINMWRASVGLGPVNQAPAGPTIAVGDTQAEVFDFTGPASDGQPAHRVVVAMASRGGRTFFFKIMGTEKLVSSAKESFDDFLKCVQFAPVE